MDAYRVSTGQVLDESTDPAAITIWYLTEDTTAVIGTTQHPAALTDRQVDI